MGDTLISSYHMGAGQDLTNLSNEWEDWSINYYQPDFITFTDDDLSIHLPMQHIYARSERNVVNLVQITGGGAYAITKSHLSGSSLI